MPRDAHQQHAFATGCSRRPQGRILSNSGPAPELENGVYGSQQSVPGAQLCRDHGEALQQERTSIMKDIHPLREQSIRRGKYCTPQMPRQGNACQKTGEIDVLHPSAVAFAVPPGRLYADVTESSARPSLLSPAILCVLPRRPPPVLAR